MDIYSYRYRDVDTDIDIDTDTMVVYFQFISFFKPLIVYWYALFIFTGILKVFKVINIFLKISPLRIHIFKFNILIKYK